MSLNVNRAGSPAINRPEATPSAQRSSTRGPLNPTQSQKPAQGLADVFAASSFESTSRAPELAERLGRTENAQAAPNVSEALPAWLQSLGEGADALDGPFAGGTFESLAPAAPATTGLQGLAQSALALLGMGGGAPAGRQAQPKSAQVRAVAFNWPSRFHRGGAAADGALFDKLATKADVMGLSEFRWASKNKKIVDHKKWGLYNPNPPGDGDKERAGQVLAWRKDKFKLVETGTSLLNRKTRIQQQAAGPTNHRGKSVIWAKLRHRKTGEIWTVAVAHFVPSKHLGGAAEELWKTQRDNLAKWMEKQGPRTLVMGDFNGEWNDRIARPLHQVAKAQTAPSHGRRSIDWVLRSHDLKAVDGGRALDNRGQSDHRPVQGVVRG